MLKFDEGKWIKVDEGLYFIKEKAIGEYGISFLDELGSAYAGIRITFLTNLSMDGELFTTLDVPSTELVSFHATRCKHDESRFINSNFSK